MCPGSRRTEGRLALIQGEAEWLAARLEPAAAPCEAALDTFARLADPLGVATLGDGEAIDALVARADQHSRAAVVYPRSGRRARADGGIRAGSRQE